MIPNKRRLKVFLCHADVDADKIRNLSTCLTRDGLDVLRLIPGQEQEHGIRKAVQESDIVLVCHSKQFNQKGLHQKVVKIILKEAELHPVEELFVIPARLEQCDVIDSLRHWQWVDLFERKDSDGYIYDGYENLRSALRLRAQQIGAVLRARRSRSPKISSELPQSEGLIPEDVVRNWLIRHDIVANPFQHRDNKGHTMFLDGMIRPDQWEYVFEPDASYVRCPTATDAQALAYVLRKECLPLESDKLIVGANRHIFPIWVWLQQMTAVQPLVTLAHSAVRTWLELLPIQPQALLELPDITQDGLLELLHWSLGSKKALISLVQLNSGFSERQDITDLIQRIYESGNGFLRTPLPSHDTLLSWLMIRPNNMDQTCLIFPGDGLLRGMSPGRLKKIDSLISDLSQNRMFTKIFASSPQPAHLALHDLDLTWSAERLIRSLEGQFDSAMHPEERSMGKSIRFHELFGPGVTPEGTTEKLVSASHGSLAHLLALGNRLLQKHCWRNISEAYLSLEELEDILKTT